MPESPYYLAVTGKHDELVNVLFKLRGKNEIAVRKEAEEIQMTAKEISKNDGTFKEIFSKKENLNGLVLCIALWIFHALTGDAPIMYYSGIIFAAIDTTNSLSAAVSMIIIAMVQLIASSITPLIIDRLGRKMLLIISGIGEILSLVSLGLYFLLKEKADLTDGDVSSINWLPITSLVIFLLSYYVGWNSVPGIILGEAISPNVKSKVINIVFVSHGIVYFGVSKVFLIIVDICGMYGVFWIFSVFCAMSVVYVIFLVPETRGKSLKDILAELGGKVQSERQNCSDYYYNDSYKFQLE